MEQENIEISIIVPIYNAEKHLKKMLDSIIMQTFDKFEVILVNDGSTDSSSLILNEYSIKYNYIKVFNKVNGGVSDARNFGLKKAKGNYIMFIDSDDYIKKCTLEKLYDVSKLYQADIVCSGYFIEEKDKYLKMCSPCELKVLDKEEAIIDFFDGKAMSISCWGKLYSKKILEGIFFNKNIKRNEDKLFFFQALCNSNKIINIPDVYYYYCMNDDSITHQFISNDILQTIEVSEKIYSIIEDSTPKIAKYGYRDLICTIFFVLNCFIGIEMNDFQKKQYKLLIKKIKGCEISSIKDIIPFKIYLQIMMIKCLPNVYFLLKRVYLKMRNYNE